MKATLLIGLAGVLTLTACNNNSKTDESAGSATATAPPGAPAPPPPPSTTAMPTTAQGFVDAAASSDMYEIAAAKLAQQMAKEETLKSFASMMVKDHTKSSADLRAAIAQAGNGLMVPTAMQAKQQADLDALKTAGDTFDTLYAQQQVAAHQAALMLLQDQAKSGTVPQLKDFAAKTAPVVQHHLDAAMKLP